MVVGVKRPNGRIAAQSDEADSTVTRPATLSAAVRGERGVLVEDLICKMFTGHFDDMSCVQSFVAFAATLTLNRCIFSKWSEIVGELPEEINDFEQCVNSGMYRSCSGTGDGIAPSFPHSASVVEGTLGAEHVRATEISHNLYTSFIRYVTVDRTTTAGSNLWDQYVERVRMNFGAQAVPALQRGNDLFVAYKALPNEPFSRIEASTGGRHGRIGTLFRSLTSGLAHQLAGNVKTLYSDSTPDRNHMKLLKAVVADEYGKCALTDWVFRMHTAGEAGAWTQIQKVFFNFASSLAYETEVRARASRPVKLKAVLPVGNFLSDTPAYIRVGKEYCIYLVRSLARCLTAGGTRAVTPLVQALDPYRIRDMTNEQMLSLGRDDVRAALVFHSVFPISARDRVYKLRTNHRIVQDGITCYGQAKLAHTLSIQTDGVGFRYVLQKLLKRETASSVDAKLGLAATEKKRRHTVRGNPLRKQGKEKSQARALDLHDLVPDPGTGGAYSYIGKFLGTVLTPDGWSDEIADKYRYLAEHFDFRGLDPNKYRYLVGCDARFQENGIHFEETKHVNIDSKVWKHEAQHRERQKYGESVRLSTLRNRENKPIELLKEHYNSVVDVSLCLHMTLVEENLAAFVRYNRVRGRRKKRVHYFKLDQKVIRTMANKLVNFGSGKPAKRKILIIGNALRDGKMPGPVRKIIDCIRRHKLAIVIMGDEFRTSMLDLHGQLHRSPKEKRKHVLNSKKHMCSLPNGHSSADDGCKCECSYAGCSNTRFSDYGAIDDDDVHACRRVCEVHSVERVEVWDLSVDSKNRTWQRDFTAAISITLRFLTQILGISLAGSLFERQSTWVRRLHKRKRFHRNHRFVAFHSRLSWSDLLVRGIGGRFRGIFVPTVRTEAEVKSYTHASRRRNHFRFPDERA
jgi:hypothetical protein